MFISVAYAGYSPLICDLCVHAVWCLQCLVSPDESLEEDEKGCLSALSFALKGMEKMCLLKMVFYRLMVFQCFHCSMARLLAIDVWNKRYLDSTCDFLFAAVDSHIGQIIVVA